MVRAMRYVMAGVTAVVMMLTCLGALGQAPREADVAPLGASTIQFSISSGTVNFGGGPLKPTETPYTQAITASVNSDKSWRITVTSDHDLRGAYGSIGSEYLTFSAAGPSGKTTYQAPAGTRFGSNTRVVEGTRGSNLTTTITYGLRVPWELEPDAFSAVHTYTASQL